MGAIRSRPNKYAGAVPETSAHTWIMLNDSAPPPSQLTGASANNTTLKWWPRMSIPRIDINDDPRASSYVACVKMPRSQLEEPTPFNCRCTNQLSRPPCSTVHNNAMRAGPDKERKRRTG